MKNIWKWFFGILLVVVILGALVAVPFAMHSYAITRSGSGQLPAQQGWTNNGPMMGRGDYNDYGGPQNKGMHGFDQRSGPMMGRGSRSNFNHGFGGFGLGLMFLGGLLRLIPVALFGLLLYGVYMLGKRSGLRAAPAVTPVSPIPAAADEPQDNETPAA